MLMQQTRLPFNALLMLGCRGLCRPGEIAKSAQRKDLLRRGDQAFVEIYYYWIATFVCRQQKIEGIVKSSHIVKHAKRQKFSFGLPFIFHEFGGKAEERRNSYSRLGARGKMWKFEFLMAISALR